MSFLDNTGLARLWEHILALANTKMDKADGKGLSTNDYTDEDKAKLEEIDSVIDGIANGSSSVPKSEESEHATEADHATVADHAITAEQDANGNIIISTYETKADATQKFDNAKLYIDTALEGKTLVQMITWEETD